MVGEVCDVFASMAARLSLLADTIANQPYSHKVSYNRGMSANETSVCPRCHYEYEPWVEVCPDCNVPVQTQVPPAAVEPVSYRQDDPHWAVATNVPNAIIGNLIKSQLQDAGIPVLMLRSPSADVAQFSHNDYVPYDLRVPRDLIEQAQQLIYSAPGDTESDDWEGGFDTPLEEEDDRLDEIRGGERKPDSLYNDRDPMASHAFTGAPGGYRTEDGSYPIEDEESADWYRSPRWVSVIYGILLLVISLPFLLQLLETTWNLLTGAP